MTMQRNWNHHTAGTIINQHTLLFEMINESCGQFAKKVCPFLKRLSIELPYDQTTPLLGVYSREMETYNHTKTSIQPFIEALLIVAKKIT